MRAASSRSASLALAGRLFAALSVLIVLPSGAGAVSDANKDRTVSLLWELGGNDVDLGGRRIQQVDARNKAEVAQCFSQVREIAGRLANNDIEVQRRLPHLSHRPSLWSPLALAAHLAHDYAINMPGIENSMAYQAMKQMEMMRKQSAEMLKSPQVREIMRAMGMDIDAMKPWAEEETKRNLRTLTYLVCR